jgi:hypothetical protein
MRGTDSGRLYTVLAAAITICLAQMVGAGEPDSLRARAAPCIARSLQQTSPMLSELLSCLQEGLGLEADSTRAWVGGQLRAAGAALGEEGTQQLLAARWAADKGTFEVDPKRGVKYLQALCKGLQEAIDSGRNFSLQMLLDKAGASARLPSAQLRPALASAVLAAGGSAAEVAGAAHGTIALELAVLSEKMLDRVPRSVFVRQDGWHDYFDYAFILYPVAGTTAFDVFFLAPQFIQEIWDQVAVQLTRAGVCRRVLVPQEGHQVRVPRLTVMATLKMVEAQHGEPAIPIQGGVPIPRGGVYGDQISQRSNGPRDLYLLLELKLPDAAAPAWRYWSLATVDVTGFGHSPFPGDTRRYPEGLIYSEPILEDVFIEKLKGSL